MSIVLFYFDCVHCRYLFAMKLALAVNRKGEILQSESIGMLKYGVILSIPPLASLETMVFLFKLHEFLLGIPNLM